jgi:uncharacterized protein (TIGR02284 family)
MDNTNTLADSVLEAEVKRVASSSIGELQSLIRLLVDSEKGFGDASVHIEHAEIAALFRSFVGERSALATELQDLVRDMGDEAPTSGTVAGTLHRSWLDLRSVITGQDSFAILSEAERGEDYIKAEYEKALRMDWSNTIHSVLSRQYLKVREAHDQVRNLRDSFSK